MIKQRFLIPLMLIVLASTAQARIYMYVDADGRKGATDRREAIPAGARVTSVIDLGGGRGGSMPTVPAERKSTTKTPSPANFPRIDSSTQRKRDDVRRTVLEEELASEQRNLDEAKRQLAVGEKPLAGENVASPSYLSRLKQLQGTVERHERNIAAIRKELGTAR